MWTRIGGVVFILMVSGCANVPSSTWDARNGNPRVIKLENPASADQGVPEQAAPRAPAASDASPDNRMACKHESSETCIAGYPFGSTFPMPQCKKTEHGTVDFPKDGACWVAENPADGPIPEIRRIWWADQPIGFKTLAFNSDGLFDNIEFDTLGIKDQDYILSQLQQKFGRPTTLNYISMQNAFGIKFLKCEAIWQHKQVYVEFNGIGEKIDEGSVEIQTQAYHKRTLEKQKQYLREHPPSKL